MKMRNRCNFVLSSETVLKVITRAVWHL